MKLKKWLYERPLPPLAWAGLSGISATCKKTILGQETWDRLHASGRPLIFCIWHGRQFLISRFLGYQNTCVLTSTSRDGRLQAAILSRFGYRIVYGSSKKNPVRALLGLVQELQNHGGNAVMAVDGPTGPIYEAKPGALFLAKKLNGLIVPLTFSVKRGRVLKAWDRYLLPAPFTPAVIMVGDPLEPSPATDKETLDRECEVLNARLNEITRQADRLMGRPDHLAAQD